MGWLKRNLFFAIGGVLALLLLLGAGYYNWQSWSHNSSAYDRLNEIYGKLKELNDKKPSPGDEKVDNTRAAKEQEAQVREWIVSAGDWFQPIKPIPDASDVTSEAFAGDLRRTIDLLQHQAETDSVGLPPKYGFTFEAQRSIVKFAPGSLGLLAVQLGEVKTISDILFAAGINALDGIQRSRVSDDDAAGPQTDYLNETSTTNNLAVLTPYVVTFRSFTPELARVLAGFAASPHGLVVKAVNVGPAGAVTPTAGGPPPFGQYGGPGLPAPPQPTVANPSRGGPPTVLKEQLLRITMEVVIVKPLPKK